MHASPYDFDGPEHLRGFVYVITLAGRRTLPVKIGWALDPGQRALTLQTGNPFPLIVSHRIPGTQLSERALHRELQAERVRGEWFEGERTTQVVDLIAAAESECEAFRKRNGTYPSDTTILSAMAIEAGPRILEHSPDGPDFPQLAEWPAKPKPKPEPEPDYIVIGESAGPTTRKARGWAPWQPPVSRRPRSGTRARKL